MSRYVYGTTMQAGRLVLDLADMHQRTTQSYVRRPYGVGMLVAAHDQTGPHLFQTCPSGNYFEYVAMAIGARSQSAKTYLEKHFEEFEVRREDFFFRVRACSLRSCAYRRQTVVMCRMCCVSRLRVVCSKEHISEEFIDRVCVVRVCVCERERSR